MTFISRSFGIAVSLYDGSPKTAPESSRIELSGKDLSKESASLIGLSVTLHDLGKNFKDAQLRFETKIQYSFFWSQKNLCKVTLVSLKNLDSFLRILRDQFEGPFDRIFSSDETPIPENYDPFAGSYDMDRPFEIAASLYKTPPDLYELTPFYSPQITIKCSGKDLFEADSDLINLSREFHAEGNKYPNAYLYFDLEFKEKYLLIIPCNDHQGALMPLRSLNGFLQEKCGVVVPLDERDL